MKYKQTINLMGGGVFFAFVGGTLSYYVVYDWVKQGIGDAKLSVLIVAGALGLAMLFNGLNWLVRQIKSRYDAAILNAIDYPYLVLNILILMMAIVVVVVHDNTLFTSDTRTSSIFKFAAVLYSSFVLLNYYRAFRARSQGKHQRGDTLD